MVAHDEWMRPTDSMRIVSAFYYNVDKNSI